MANCLKDKLLKLQEIDFVLADLKLYLDTHPWDTNMLMTFSMYAQKSIMLKNEIETKYRYPLTAKSAAFYGPKYEWINSPWPWCGKDPKPVPCNKVDQATPDSCLLCGGECEKEDCN